MTSSIGSATDEPGWEPHLKQQTQALDRIRDFVGARSAEAAIAGSAR